MVHDEMDLPVGRAKMRVGGGAAGHGGIESIINRCGEEFTRLKIGIGTPPDEGEVDGADWVLGEPGVEEEAAIVELMPKVAGGIDRWILDGPEKAMAWFNTEMKPVVKDEEVSTVEEGRVQDE